MNKRGICFIGETNTPSREERRPSAFPNNKDPSNFPLRGIWPREDGGKNGLIKGFNQIPNCKKPGKKYKKVYLVQQRALFWPRNNTNKKINTLCYNE